MSLLETRASRIRPLGWFATGRIQELPASVSFVFSVNWMTIGEKHRVLEGLVGKREENLPLRGSKSGLDQPWSEG
jgi:hypothetical protein